MYLLLAGRAMDIYKDPETHQAPHGLCGISLESTTAFASTIWKIKKEIKSISNDTEQNEARTNFQTKDISDSVGPRTSGEPAVYSFGSARPASSPPQWVPAALDVHVPSVYRPWLTPQQMSIKTY